ncbi:hypothetical protein MHBO_001590 [Bonamia ostreae]
MKHVRKRDKIVNEAKIISSLKHKNIVSLHEILKSNDEMILVLDYCGENHLMNWNKIDRKFSVSAAAKRLFDSNGSTFTEKGVFQIAKCLSEIIKYLRDKNVAHRDIKPENILINNDNEDISLIDFSISESFENISPIFSSNNAGTPNFMAPETGKPEYCPFKAEVWSFGVLLFVLRFGFAPFDAEKRNDVFNNINNKPIAFAEEDVSDKFRALLEKMLCKEPLERISIDGIIKFL